MDPPPPVDYDDGMAHNDLIYPGGFVQHASQEVGHRIMVGLTLCEGLLDETSVALTLYCEASAMLATGMRPGSPPPPLPRWFVSAKRQLAAKSFVAALATIGRQLRHFADDDPALAPIYSEYATRLPSVASVRNSSQHVEQRGRREKAHGKPIAVQPVRTAAFHMDNSVMLGGFDGDLYGFTGDDGHYHQVPITDATADTARELVQRAINALTWTGYPRTHP